MHVPYNFFSNSYVFLVTILSDLLCRMQALDEHKTIGRWSVAYLGPSQISETEHTFVMSDNLKKEIEEQAKTRGERCYDTEIPCNL